MKRRFRCYSIAACALMLAIFTTCMPSRDVLARMNDGRQDDELIIGRGAGDSTELFVGLVKVIVALVLIIGLIYLVARFLSKKNEVLFGRRSVRVLSGVQLAPGKSLQIVELGGHLYVLGVGEDVHLLDRITDAEQVAAITQQLMEPEGKTLVPAFGEWWSKWKQRRSDSQVMSQQPTFEQLFREKLSRSGDERKIEQLLAQYEQDEKERSKQ